MEREYWLRYDFKHKDVYERLPRIIDELKNFVRINDKSSANLDAGPVGYVYYKSGREAAKIVIYHSGMVKVVTYDSTVLHEIGSTLTDLL